MTKKIRVRSRKQIISPDHLSFQCVWPDNEQQFVIRFYEKILAKPGGEVDYGRIIGHVYHHRSWTSRQTVELLRYFEKATGMPHETIDLLIESLPSVEGNI